VGNIVDSLFADYLPPKQQESVPVVNPQQQTMLTNQMLTPVMDKPVMSSQEVPVFPLMGNINNSAISTTEEDKEEQEEETTPPLAYDPSNINLAAINNINTGDFDSTNLGLFQ